jgi:uncharacterized cupredoxin-like copper-binding protein
MNKPRITSCPVSALGVLIAGTLAAPEAWAHGTAHGSKSAAPAQVETDFGRTGQPAKVTRTVQVHMSDRMRFEPDTLTVRAGDTVRFVVRNEGKLMHEFVLGTARELAEHAEAMKKFPNMEHEEPYMAHVAPGQKGEVVWQFTRPGEFLFGCLLPGHFDAGMVGRVHVLAR